MYKHHIHLYCNRINNLSSYSRFRHVIPSKCKLHVQTVFSKLLPAGARHWIFSENIRLQKSRMAHLMSYMMYFAFNWYFVQTCKEFSV